MQPFLYWTLSARPPQWRRTFTSRALSENWPAISWALKTTARRHSSLYRTAGADQSARDMTGSLADTNWALGALDAALAGFRAIIDVMRTSNRTTTLGLGVALTNLAGVLTELGHLDEALGFAREGLALRKDGGYVWGALDHLALRAALAGKFEEAARLAGYVDSVFAAKKEVRQPNEARARGRLVQLLSENLKPDECIQLLAQGATITEEEAYRLALCD